MRSLILAYILMMTVNAVSAQNLKFGKPTTEELNLTECAEAPDAPAVILCKTMNLTYDLSSSYEAYGNITELDQSNYSHSGVNKFVTAEGANMTYLVKHRTKILKDEGKGYANMDIYYYNVKDDIDKRDEFYAFTVTIYNNIGGKVKKVRLEKEAYKDERLNNEYMVRHVRIPDAKAGSIIDVQFEMFSKRIAYIYDWQFQDDIPVRYAQCNLQVPAFLSYNVNAAIRPNITSKVERGILNLKQEISDLQAPKRCLTNDYTIISRDMLPWPVDPIREKKGATYAEVRPYIDSALFKGIPTPTPIPEGRFWIITNPQ